jgi:hypothetical protein
MNDTSHAARVCPIGIVPLQDVVADCRRISLIQVLRYHALPWLLTFTETLSQPAIHVSRSGLENMIFFGLG